MYVACIIYDVHITMQIDQIVIINACLITKQWVQSKIEVKEYTGKQTHFIKINILTFLREIVFSLYYSFFLSYFYLMLHNMFQYLNSIVPLIQCTIKIITFKALHFFFPVNSKIKNLKDYRSRILNNVTPQPTGIEIENTLKYFSQTLRR